jgi:uncharacterized protein
MVRAKTKVLNAGTVLLLLSLLASCTTVQAPATDGTLPQPQGFVSDFAGKLSSDTKQALEGLLRTFADQNGIELAVVTIPFDDMHGLAIEAYSLSLGRKWGIGRGPEKLALLLLVAIKPADNDGLYHGATRLEVSRRLERDIPDELAGEVIRTMRDDFSAGRFDQAINAGVELILATLSEKRGIPR